MQDIKRCQKCGEIISSINSADYYSHIRIKYCKKCGPEVNRLNAAERAKRVRAQTKANNKLARELNNALMQENELLKRQLEELRERLGITVEELKENQ